MSTHDDCPFEVFSPSYNLQHVNHTVVIACHDNNHFMYVKMSDDDVSNCWRKIMATTEDSNPWPITTFSTLGAPANLPSATENISNSAVTKMPAIAATLLQPPVSNLQPASLKGPAGNEHRVFSKTLSQTGPMVHVRSAATRGVGTLPTKQDSKSSTIAGSRFACLPGDVGMEVNEPSTATVHVLVGGVVFNYGTCVLTAFFFLADRA